MYVFLHVLIFWKNLLLAPEMFTGLGLAYAQETTCLAAAHLHGAPVPPAAIVGTNLAKPEVRHLTSPSSVLSLALFPFHLSQVCGTSIFHIEQMLYLGSDFCAVW